jgi:hypothetical protein
MIVTKTHKVKVWDHNDAVVFVYENRWEKTNPKDKDCHKYKHWKEVLTAIPMNFGYDENFTEEMVVEKVQAVANSLEAVYVHDCDCHEIGISYTINYNRQYVNA